MRRKSEFVALIAVMCLFLLVGASWATDFYPFSGDLNGGGGASDLDKITSTNQGDAAIGITQGHATWGDGVFFFTLDVDGGAGDAEPTYVNSGDGGNERWILGTVHNSTAITALPQADDLWSGEVIRGINAGENIGQWDTVFLNSADGEWHEADATAASGESPAYGIAVVSLDGTWPAVDGDPLWVMTRGVVRNDDWTGYSIGDKVYLGKADGTITGTAPSDDGDCIQPIGRVLGTDGDEIYFDFDPLNGYYEHN